MKPLWFKFLILSNWLLPEIYLIYANVILYNLLVTGFLIISLTIICWCSFSNSASSCKISRSYESVKIEKQSSAYLLNESIIQSVDREIGIFLLESSTSAANFMHAHANQYSNYITNLKNKVVLSQYIWTLSTVCHSRVCASIFIALTFTMKNISKIVFLRLCLFDL